MKNILRVSLGSALGAIALAACDAAAPPDAAVPRPVESEAIPAGETLTDVVREALADVLRDKDAYSRARRLGALLPTLGPELVPAVKQSLEDLRLALGATEIELLVRYWTTHQPEDASRWALKKSSSSYRIPAVTTALTVWAEADPQAATTIAWPWANEHPEISVEVHRALLRGWHAAGDPPELRQFIQDLGTGWSRQRAISVYVRAVLRTQEREALFRWAESLPDDDAGYKLAVYRQVIGQLQGFDHEAALRWCEAHCDGPYGKNVRRVIGGRWARSDGAAALEWLSSAPEGLDTNRAVHSAFGVWSRRDPEAAQGWVAARTTGEPYPWLETIIPAYALLLAEDAPADAIEWAERIEGVPNREWVLIQVARAWLRVDEAAAETWLLQSSLSEEAREKARVPGRTLRPTREQPPEG